MIADLTATEASVPVSQEETTSTGPKTCSEGRLVWNRSVWPREYPPRRFILSDEVFMMEMGMEIATGDGDGYW